MDNSLALYYNITIKLYNLEGVGTVFNLKERIARLVAALIAAALLVGGMAVAEATDDAGGLGFEFGDDGYTGEWVEIAPLKLELCLPEGWAQNVPAEGIAFSAALDDGAVTLNVYAVADKIDDLQEWMEQSPEAWTMDEAGLYDAAVIEEPERVSIRVRIEGGRLIAFDFTRVSEEVLPRAYALQIAGTASELWMDQPTPEPGAEAATGEGQGAN